MSITMSVNLSIHTHKHGNQYTALVRRVTKTSRVTLYHVTDATRSLAVSKAKTKLREMMKEAA